MSHLAVSIFEPHLADSLKRLVTSLYIMSEQVHISLPSLSFLSHGWRINLQYKHVCLHASVSEKTVRPGGPGVIAYSLIVCFNKASHY